MFTGIIRATSKIKKTEIKGGSLYLSIAKPAKWSVQVGSSIAVDGACLTVKKIVSGNMIFEVMPETIEKTYLSGQIYSNVNLERALKANDFLDGHIILGHIDTVGVIKRIAIKNSSCIYTFSFPAKFSNLLADKGSIAVDGISLTSINVTKTSFSVSLVNYTLENTTLGEKKKGDLVNLEFDILAKYLLKK